jgi:hypothetical protein
MTTAAAALATDTTATAEAGAGAPSAAANDNASGTGAPAAAPGAAAGAAVQRLDWLGDAPDELHGFAAANGYKGPADVLTNVRELQKYLGADKAGRGVVIPKDAGDAEAWGAVYDKLGRPADAAGYGLGELEGADPDFSRAAGETFHKLGLSARQGAELAKWWGEAVTAGKAADDEAYLARADEQMAALRSEWGAAADANQELARRGAAAFGFSGDELDKLERAIGTKALMARFLEVGRKLGEDAVPAGKSAAAGLSPAAAQEQIAELMADRDFSAKVRAGDPVAKKKMENLYRAAYPG